MGKEEVFLSDDLPMINSALEKIEGNIAKMGGKMGKNLNVKSNDETITVRLAVNFDREYLKQFLESVL